MALASFNGRSTPFSTAPSRRRRLDKAPFVGPFSTAPSRRRLWTAPFQRPCSIGPLSPRWHSNWPLEMAPLDAPFSTATLRGPRLKGRSCPTAFLAQRPLLPNGHYCPTAILAQGPFLPKGHSCARAVLAQRLLLPNGLYCSTAVLAQGPLLPKGHSCPTAFIAQRPLLSNGHSCPRAFIAQGSFLRNGLYCPTAIIVQRPFLPTGHSCATAILAQGPLLLKGRCCPRALSTVAARRRMGRCSSKVASLPPPFPQSRGTFAGRWHRPTSPRGSRIAGPGSQPASSSHPHPLDPTLGCHLFSRSVLDPFKATRRASSRLQRAHGPDPPRSASPECKRRSPRKLSEKAFAASPQRRRSAVQRHRRRDFGARDFGEDGVPSHPARPLGPNRASVRAKVQNQRPKAQKPKSKDGRIPRSHIFHDFIKFQKF
ncbi:hypothetical protein M885DRAFT_503699 [Pelagophyceae sp. CCMP2097]|nr:hypothetical protein M885DRAFT_503699 [Pelagophyceae sp. CCMP2097]